MNVRYLVQVPAGEHPRFAVTAITNRDSGRVTCGNVPNGSGSSTVDTCWVTGRTPART